MTLVLIDPQLGARITGYVARRMPDAVAWPASTLATMVPPVQAAQTLSDLQDDDEDWDGAVGLGFGCGPAASLVRSGRARRAVLIDPAAFQANDSGLELVWAVPMFHPDGPRRPYDKIIEALGEDEFQDPRDVVLDDIHEAERWVARTAPPFEAVRILFQPPPRDLSTTGPYPREGYAAYAAMAYGTQVTDDPGLWDRVTTICQEAEEARQPYDDALPSQPDESSTRDLNWLSAWTDPDLDITIWLSQEAGFLARPLARRGPDRPLVTQPWRSLAWLTDPQRLARAMTDWSG
ncbi:hypothetical protein [Acidipropionibacterium virtanenii]|uniref:Uncharacterized protein n=1 Tax=Acidipropionibacterium virtanenii TaxID=2057246 RepID=A0A344UUN9_9ACTN|nr:hypothetical protein [Acidipropionibacterium virtanenii]AXE38987.1 hypothetical protein JS278_01828 [Acidipropionibacterium virtanenii]